MPCAGNRATVNAIRVNSAARDASSKVVEARRCEFTRECGKSHEYESFNLERDRAQNDERKSSTIDGDRTFAVDTYPMMQREAMEPLAYPGGRGGLKGLNSTETSLKLKKINTNN